MRLPRTALGFIILALVVPTAGCVGFVDGAAESGTEVRQELSKAEPPETLSATVETTTTTTTPNGSDTRTITESVWLRETGESRTEGGGERSGDEDGGYVVVDDGDTVWHQESGSVTSYESQNNDTSRLERIYAEQERYFERFDVQSVDETTVDGRRAHRVVFEPHQNETVERSIDVMVDETTYRIPLETELQAVDDDQPNEIEIVFDAETMFPLQFEMVSDRVEFSVTYRDVSFNDELEDDLFEFEPPADSESEGITLPEITEYDTVEAANESVYFTVSAPDADTLPSGFDLESVTRTVYLKEDRTQVTQSYRDDEDRSVRVAIGDGPRAIPVEGSPASVNGADATLGETEHGTELEWEHDGHYYHVFADADLEEETVLEIAQSLHA
ncbi:outer membrane lipoprotein-sorting protein [Halostagnicola kamekurae]|uniref:Outer membrane lipoprotein-sorting protein n=1 Tax=Halostagnicola kamekurae TaxID=619731 RepID=A0A1I6SJA0_9EURY|nr:DUF4367 domain-containing protein [Halostagnicola kamekurae]SFS77051.1 Outer membrane lipoprotein-sorting protein [Halostagnicola kamekurae]